MKAAKSCGEPVLPSTPSRFMLAIISGERSAVLVAALSLSMTAAGVPAGAHSPTQKPSEQAREAALDHGRHLRQFRRARASLHTAIARTLPSRISGSSVAVMPMLRWMVPPSMSVTACMPPL